MGDYQENEFLSDLLTLQQEGSGAISAPSNWATAPLLSVETKLDRKVDAVIPRLLSDAGQNRNGVWWFLVGSPGNGKSAAVGRLVRRLHEEKGAIFRLEKDSSGALGQDITTMTEGEIPYLVELYEEGGKYPTAWFAQDASVVRNPFAEITDPARELIKLMKDASKKGVSLVVCANRGVLEKAYEISGRHKQNKGSTWFRALQSAAAGKENQELKLETEAKKPVFDTVDLVVTPLDAQSIIVEGTFKDLIDEATSANKWEDCLTCAANKLCPFKQNRDWLADSGGGTRLVSSMRLAELFSGQVVVFREAVAFISLLLAGCTRDYKSETPCRWVQRNQETGALFSLLSRRIYMLMFSSFSPFGLDDNDKDQAVQLGAISELANQPGISETAVHAVNALVLPDYQVSTGVGVRRLLGPEGVFAMLDPVKEGQSRELEQRWDSAPGRLIDYEQCLISPLEKRCFEIWEALETGLENYGVHTVPTYRFLRRWITNVTYRLGFFAEGDLLFEKDLEEIDEIISSTDGEASAAHLIKLEKISKQLSKMLSITDDRIEISPVVNIVGRWVGRMLEVEILSGETKGGGLSAKVGDGEFEISAVAYAWLNRKDRTGLSKETFPDDILQVAEDIRRKAATNSGYAFADKDVGLQISLPGNRGNFLLRRVKDHVVVEEGTG